MIDCEYLAKKMGDHVTVVGDGDGDKVRQISIFTI